MVGVLGIARAGIGGPSRAGTLHRCGAVRGTAPVAADWREKAKPIAPGSPYPAKEHCSKCGLCDTYYVAHVKEACAFLGSGMSDVEAEMEQAVHGRRRDPRSEDEDLLGVVERTLYARVRPSVPGAQWTGIVTSIATRMLERGMVDAVVCVQSQV